MYKLVWTNFLHLYQPPTQKPYWIKRVTEESYRKIVQGLLIAPDLKITMNVSGILLELLEQCGFNDVIDGLRTLVERGQLELTGSAKYHALLPFLPPDEIERQIRLNEQTLRRFFGSNLKLRGFFPPEMASSPNLARTISKLGYEWMIIDELSFPRNPNDKNANTLKYDHLYTMSGLPNFHLFFRERRMSWVILSGQIGTGNLLIKSLGERLERSEYLLTAMDGETFGHHRPGLETLLFEIYQDKNLNTACISDLLSLFTEHETISPRPSTWALMEKDLELSKPFSRWFDEDNSIHKLQWQLTNLAIEVLHKAPASDPGYTKAREMLDRALHSDQYWWASARPWWSLEMIERGAKEFYDSIITTPDVPTKTSNLARHLYHSIVFTAFDWQRSGLVDEIAHKEDEDIRQRTDVGLPQLPKTEVEKMINRLQEEMNLSASRQEYERAAQVRDRISELRRYIAEVDVPIASPEGEKEWDI